MRRIESTRLPRRQRGLALLVLLALFATAAAYMLVSSLNRGSVALSLTRSETNRAVMQQAKEALLAWAASEVLQTQSGGAFRPGRLPCPDRTNVDGSALGSCATVNLLGRLPYKTLGIAPLYDASGELLWYAVSNNFKTGASTINADTQGTLTISGLAPASNAVAVVFSPGMRLGAQDRSSTGANTATNYLEGINSDSDYATYVAAAENLTDTVTANLFNDQLLVITRQDLLAAVEPVVAARIQRDIVLEFIYNPVPGTSSNWTDGGGTDKRRYFDAWGAFPFAATFANPGSSSYTGVAGTYEGLLPMVGTLSYYWNGGSGSVVKTGGSGSISSSCSTPGSPNTILRCVITSSGWSGVQPDFRMSGTVSGVGLSFVQLPRLSDVSTSGGSITGTRSIGGSLNSSGTGTVMLNATMPWSWSGTTITVDINNDNLITSQLISAGDLVAGWFNTDQWYKQVYYAVSPGYAPGGSGSCTAGSTCLTVNNLSTTPTNDKRAILILAGRSLAGAARPNATIGDYLESQNASTGDRVFEHGPRTVSTTGAAINDKVIVVAP